MLGSQPRNSRFDSQAWWRRMGSLLTLVAQSTQQWVGGCHSGVVFTPKVVVWHHQEVSTTRVKKRRPSDLGQEAWARSYKLITRWTHAHTHFIYICENNNCRLVWGPLKFRHQEVFCKETTQRKSWWQSMKIITINEFHLTVIKSCTDLEHWKQYSTDACYKPRDARDDGKMSALVLVTPSKDWPTPPLAKDKNRYLGKY